MMPDLEYLNIMEENGREINNFSEEEAIYYPNSDLMVDDQRLGEEEASVWNV